MSRNAIDIFPPDQQFFLSDGSVNNAGYMYVYEPDQAYSTQKTVYKDRAKGTSWTQPITFDSEGRLTSPVKSEGLVDIKVFDSDDNLIETHDNAGDDWSAVGTDLSENLVSNHSFETAGSGSDTFANWTDTDSGSVINRNTSGTSHGGACAQFASSQNGADYLTSDIFPIDATLDVFVRFAIVCSNASCEPEMQFLWYDISQSYISTTTVYDSDAGTTPTSVFQAVPGVNVSPPSTARYAAVRLIGNNSATQYNSNWDNIYVTQKETAAFGVVTRTPTGLELSRDAGDTSHDINVTAGAVLDSTYAKEIVLKSEITKQIDSGWAVGDDAGGLASGSSLSANGYVNVFVGLKSGTGLVDVFFDTGDYDSPSPPTGFDFYRYLGMWPLDSSSNLEAGVMKGGRFTKNADPAAEISSTVAYNVSEQTATINAPPLSTIDYAARLEVASGQADDVVIQIKPASSSWTNTNIGQGAELTTDTIDEFHVRGTMPLDSSSQLKWDVAIAGHTGNMTLNLFCLGWYDVLRDNP